MLELGKWIREATQKDMVKYTKWKHFSALLALSVGNSPVTGEFPSQRPVTPSLEFFNLPLNKRLSKQWTDPVILLLG